VPDSINAEAREAVKIPFEFEQATRAGGTPEDIIEFISKYIKVGCRYFMISFPSDAQTKLFKDEVMPHFK